VIGSESLTASSAAGAVCSASLPPSWAVELARQFPEAFSLASVRMPGINSLEGKALEAKVAQAYAQLFDRFRRAARPHPMRIWNFLPRILDASGDGLDRYMRFNAGRFQAFRVFFGDVSFDKVVPAASAVGCDGDELVVHALLACKAGEPVANPRQRDPYCYSRRFGPLPPCFARAMRIEHKGEKLLMIGGTASVRGEDSVHVGDLVLQLQETTENLSALIAAAFGSRRSPLSLLTNLRVYFVRRSDCESIQKSVNGWFESPRPIEWFQADLCRSDLLVEIEGLARCPP
jgi:hypothetical protein